MATQKQIEANRNNAKKSTGPRTPEGKGRSRMNSLRHGLRSNQVVLPGESAAEFDAEVKGWRDDWQPKTHTQAVLCERTAAASWRLRRCVRAEADLLQELAERRAHRRLGRAGADADDEARRRVEEAADDLRLEPERALARLRSSPEGVDFLLGEWDGLDGWLRDNPRAWDLRECHEWLMGLLGLAPDSDPAAAGPWAVGSRRLAAANESALSVDRLDDDEAAAIAAAIRRAIRAQREALRAHRATLAEPAGEAAEDDDGIKLVGVTKPILLLHRYEMAHERSMRAAMKDLLTLEKAGIGAGRGADKSAEVIEVKMVESREPEPASRPESAASPAPSEPNPEAPREAPSKVRRDRKGRTWPVEPAEGGGSAS